MIRSRLSIAINFCRLIEAQPALARLLGAILSHAPPLAEALGRRPELFDGLLDASALDPLPDVPALAAEMTAREAGDDYQVLLDRIRRVVGERRFALGTQIVAGVSDPIEVSAGYVRIAGAAIEGGGAATVSEFVARPGRAPERELVILALGVHGGVAVS